MIKKEIKEKKIRIINEQKPIIEKLLTDLEKRKKRERACFWTWPWGHKWPRFEGHRRITDLGCLICGASWPYD